MEANLLRQLSTGPAEILISSIWQGLLLTGFAWAALKLAPGLRASTRFTLWLIAFLLVALLPFFAMAGGFFGPHPMAAAMPPAGYSLHLNNRWALALDALWALASLWALGRLLASGLAMRSLWQNSTPVPFPSLDQEIQSVLAAGGSRGVEIRLSDAIDAPSVVGFLHPAILVPRSLWCELSSSELKDVILHEKAHLDRGDDWTNLLQKLLRAFCPLNPALAWAERRLCLEREQACDDAVLDNHGNPRAYATCLTKLAESRLVRRAAALAPGFWKRHSELAGRVENILHRRRTPHPLFTRGLVAASLLASLSGALALQRCPGIITFAGGNAATAQSASSGAGEGADTYEPADQKQPRARYQQASFHPATTGAGMKILPARLTEPVAARVNSPAAATRPARTRIAQLHSAHKANTPRLRLLEIRSTTEDGEAHMTLILFTVEAPQASSKQSHSLTPAIPENWIVFQI